MNNNNENYYAILGIERGADIARVRAAYRRLMQKEGVHPDRGGEARTAALINKAYAILTNPDQKQEYDLRMDVLAKVSEGLTPAQPENALDPDSACLFCGHPHEFSGYDMADMSCEICRGALQPVNPDGLSPDGLRATQRIFKSMQVHFYTDARQRRGHLAKTEDVSPQGLRMTTREPLVPGQRLRIVSDVLEAIGEVVNCTRHESLLQSETVAGVAFLTLRYKQSAGTFVSRTV